MSIFDNKFLIWDVESTSNKPTEDDIISIGAVLCKLDENGVFQKLDSFHTYVNTNKKIDTIAQSIHHISKEDLYGQPIFPAAIELFKQFIQPYIQESNARLILIAHNGSKFDDVIMYCNFIQHRLDFDQFMCDIKCYGFLDTLKFFRLIFKNCPYQEKPQDANTSRVSFALGHCYQSFCGGDVLENAHDALADSQALYDVLTSECVKNKFTTKLLFQNIVHRQKALKYIKQTAGVAFQNMEKHTRESVLEDKPEVKVSTVPIFESDDTIKVNRLCLNCMSFVQLDHHQRCESDPQKLVKVSHDNMWSSK